MAKRQEDMGKPLTPAEVLQIDRAGKAKSIWLWTGGAGIFLALYSSVYVSKEVSITSAVLAAWSFTRSMQNDNKQTDLEDGVYKKPRRLMRVLRP